MRNAKSVDNIERAGMKTIAQRDGFRLDKTEIRSENNSKE